MLFIEEMSPEKYMEDFPQGLESVRIDSVSRQALYGEVAKRAAMLAPGEFRLVELVHPIKYDNTVTLSTRIKGQDDLPNHMLISQILHANGYDSHDVNVVGKSFKRKGIGVGTSRFKKERFEFVCRYTHVRAEQEMEDVFDTFDQAKARALDLLKVELQTDRHDYEDIRVEVQYVMFDPLEGWVENSAPRVFAPHREYSEYEVSVDVKIPATDVPSTKLVIGNTA